MKTDNCKQNMEGSEQVIIFEENFITGPPASRSVIDNLRKLLTQRQHSRESDSENKNTLLQSECSNSDAAFYSEFTTSTSESDDSDDYPIFEEMNTQTKKNGRRRLRRRHSSSSTSSSDTPVGKRRRKAMSLKLTYSAMDEGGRSGLLDNTNTNVTSPTAAVATLSAEMDMATTSKLSVASPNTADNSALSTSSHKDSSSDDENSAHVYRQKSRSGESKPASNGTGHEQQQRCPKLKSRRDRNRKRKRSDSNGNGNGNNYATHRPKLLKSTGMFSQIPTILITPSTDSANNTSENTYENQNDDEGEGNGQSQLHGDQQALQEEVKKSENKNNQNPN